MKNQHLKTGIIKKCLVCSTEYYCKKHKLKRSKFCSQSCANKHHALEKIKNRPMLICTICLNKYYRRSYYRKLSKYCSIKCKSLDEKYKPITDEENLKIIKQKYEKYIIRHENGCWGWKGWKTTHGYGYMTDGRGNNLGIHRASWLISNGSIPENLFVLHNCPTGDLPVCSNPLHLKIGTAKDNSLDMIRKGRGKNQFSKNYNNPKDDDSTNCRDKVSN